MMTVAVGIVGEIPLTQGKVALVDDADLPIVGRYRWYAAKVRRGFYAARKSPQVDGVRSIIFMHRALLPGVVEVDHKNGNGLDNRRLNLRPATTAQNQSNQRVQSRVGKKSSFKGVTRTPYSWRASIRVNDRFIHLGCFDTEIEAAKVYDKAAKRHFGEYARINFDG